MSSSWLIAASPYLDASALAKIYLPEIDSEKLNSSLRGRRDIRVSDLSVTEVVSALARRQREGALPQEKDSRLHRALVADLAAGLFEEVLRLDPRSHREAESLLLSSTIPLRALDALHLALARSGASHCILTFDARLARAARAIGLPAFPETPSERGDEGA
ncbi:MAG: type II toxin-antitoxin system VapC family toxin [Thermoanaerobaculia bacterium]